MPIRNEDKNLLFPPRDNTRVGITNSQGYVPATGRPVYVSTDSFRWDDGPLGYMPVVGDVLQGVQAYDDLRNRRYGQAALGAGLLFLPNIFEKAGRQVGSAIIDYAARQLNRHPGWKPKAYKTANSLMDLAQKYSTRVDDYLKSYSPEAQRDLDNIDIAGVRKNALNYQMTRDLETAPLVKGIEGELSIYDEARTIPVIPATRREVLLNNLGLTKAASGYGSDIALNYGNRIVAYPTVTAPVVGHEFRHSIQKGFTGEKAIDPSTGKFVPISRMPLIDNPNLQGVRDLIEKYNPNSAWHKKIAELDAEVERARQEFHPNTSWKELWDKQDGRLDDSLKHIRKTFNLQNNDEANYIMKTLYENGYCGGGTLLKSYKDGGKVDWSGIKTTNNRPYNPDYIGYINTALQNGGMNDYQRAAVLANIIEESGGDPFSKSGDGFYGLLQWASDRYTPTKEKDVYREIDNQVKTILSTAGNSTDRKSWTHGGKGSGYNSLKDAMSAYNGKTIEDVMKGYTLGYVRPTGGLNSYSNRLKVAQQILGKEGFSTFSGGGPIHIDPSKKGTFRAQATKMGMSVQQAASHILAHKENYSPTMIQKAVFANNFAHRHDNGGALLREYDGGGVITQGKPFTAYQRFMNNHPNFAHRVRKAGTLAVDLARVLPQTALAMDFVDAFGDNDKTTADALTTRVGLIGRLGDIISGVISEGQEASPSVRKALSMKNPVFKFLAAPDIVSDGLKFIRDFSTPVEKYNHGGTLLRRFDGGGDIPVFSPLADFRSAHSPVRESEFRGFGGGDFGGAGASTRFDVGVDPLVFEQYVRNTPIMDEISFSDAYSRARKAGLKEFDFNGQRYNTDYDPNAKIGPRVTAVSPVLNIREVLDENKNPISDSTRVEPYTGQIPGVHRKDYGGLIEKYGADQILKAIERRKERLK